MYKPEQYTYTVQFCCQSCQYDTVSSSAVLVTSVKVVGGITYVSSRILERQVESASGVAGSNCVESISEI